MSAEKLSATLRRLHEAHAPELPRIVAEAAAELTAAKASWVVLASSGGQARVVASTGLAVSLADAFEAPLDAMLPARLREHFGITPEEVVAAAPVLGGAELRGLVAARQPSHPQAESLLLALAEHATLALRRTGREQRLAEAEQAAAAALEERDLLRGLLATLPVGIWVADGQGKTRAASAWAREQSGAGGPWLQPAEGLTESREPPLQRALRGGQLVREEEWVLRNRGSALPILCTAAPLPTGDGGGRGAVLLAQELGGHLAREAEERERAAQQEADRAKEILFNALSHELRTPLAAILFALEVLQHPEASPAQCERAYRTIQRNVQHQVHLIDDLLDISRIMRRRARIEPRPLDLRELVSTRGKAFQDAADRGGLSLRVQVPTEPIPVNGDLGRLEQLVDILVENAIKFTEAGGDVLLQLENESGFAVLSVRDTGVGIAPDLLPRLFQPLQQADRTLGRSRGGLGVGLAIARWIVEQHAGHTAAASTGLGEGSEFVVRLPLMAEGLREAGCRRPNTHQVDHPSSHSLARRVLVVEDNRDLLDSLLSLLEMLGHHVVPAPNATKALEAAQREHPEVAFIDIGLPDMDGYELARKLRSLRALAGMRLVALTGFASEGHRERALEAGFDDYLAKPVDLETVKMAMVGAGSRGSVQESTLLHDDVK